jgi:hypothetical protein
MLVNPHNLAVAPPARRIWTLSLISVATLLCVAALLTSRPDPYPFLKDAQVVREEEWIEKPGILRGLSGGPTATVAAPPRLKTGGVYRLREPAQSLAKRVRQDLGKGWGEASVHGDICFTNGNSFVTLQPRAEGTTVYIQSYRHPNIVDHARLWIKKNIG